MFVEDIPRFLEGLDASVDGEVNMRKLLLQFIDSVIPQGRHIAVLSWIQALEKSLTSMDDKVTYITFLRNL